MCLGMGLRLPSVTIERATSMLGTRYWVFNDGWLDSPHQKYTWHPGINYPKCATQSSNCECGRWECGLYAFGWESGFHLNMSGSPNLFVWGVVLLHNARPRATVYKGRSAEICILAASNKDIARTLEKNYDVPVIENKDRCPDSNDVSRCSCGLQNKWRKILTTEGLIT